MSFNVTQCPACESTFNTNSRVLAAAAGKVRCGACLNVFEAIDNFLIPEEADAALDQGESVFVGNDPQAFFDPSSFLTRSALSETPDDEPIHKQNLHQELEKSETVSEDFLVTVAGELQGRAEAPAAENRYEDEDEDPHIESKQPFLGIGLSASFTFDPSAPPQVRIGAPKAESPPDQETASEHPVDQSSASGTESFGAIEKLPQEEKPAPNVLAPSDSVWSPVNDEVTAPPSNEEATQSFAVEEEKEESIAAPVTDNENLVVGSESPSEEIDDIQSLTKQEELANENVAKDEEPTIGATQTSARVIDENSTQAIRARALEAELSDEEALEAIPRENLAALGSMSTPVELLARKESRLLRRTLLFLSILLLGGLLSSQYLWQRMELYSQLPQLRPLYEVACTYLNCALPQYADIDSIRSENLTVQTHPTLANGLMVNTVIRNSAEFEQPFPILVLSFNSVENSVIALREFTSAEYLDPGLRSTQAMPAETPVQIRLAIMDPGPEAVNYTLAFRWP
jgi:predicted Zn finger-like uncharacterized protein